MTQTSPWAGRLRAPTADRVTQPSGEALRAWIVRTHEALQAVAGEPSRIAWGPKVVRHRTTKPDWFAGMRAAWARPLPDDGQADVDLITAAFDDVAPLVELPALRRGDLGARGEVTVLSAGDVRMVWDDVAGLVQAWDPASGRAICLMAQPPDGYELVSPLRTLVHWVVVAAGGLLMHAASVGRPAAAGPVRGALLLGEAGYGKSTTTLACLQRGWVTCGDDAVVLGREHGQWVVWPVYAAVKTKLHSEHVDMWSDADIVTWEIAGTKRAHRLTATDSGLLADQMVVDALVVLDPAADPDAAWTQVSGSRARTLAAPSTAIPLPFDRDVVLRRIGELCAQTASYVLPRRTQLPTTVEHVGQILDAAQRRISVVIPVYNGAGFVADAIASITSQTHGSFEILAVDDGSTDDSVAVLEGLVPDVAATGNTLRVLRHATNTGVAAARNSGVQAATSGWVCFLDQDDVWPPGRTGSMLAAAQETGADVVFGRMAFTDLGSDSARPWMRPEWFEGDHRGHAMGAALIRRAVFEDVGPLDESNRTGTDDVDWIMRVRDSGLRVVDSPTLAVERRIHTDNTSRDGSATRAADLLAIVRGHRQRTRDRKPRLDVVIPARNATAFIKQAVDSALAQEGAQVHVVVVDDGSDDHLDRLVASWDEPRVTYLRHPRSRGIGAARNTGLGACQGEWLGFLDADDMWPHDRFLRLSALVRDPGREIACGHMLVFDDGSAPDPGLAHPAAGLPPAAVGGGYLLSRALFLRVGLFDEELPVGEFIDWMDRARVMGVQERLSASVSLLRRSHADNTTRTQDLTSYLEVVARARARHRAARGE